MTILELTIISVMVISFAFTLGGVIILLLFTKLTEKKSFPLIMIGSSALILLMISALYKSLVSDAILIDAMTYVRLAGFILASIYILYVHKRFK